MKIPIKKEQDRIMADLVSQRQEARQKGNRRKAMKVMRKMVRLSSQWDRTRQSGGFL